jgi:peptide/nickel transport system substrate-binding protein
MMGRCEVPGRRIQAADTTVSGRTITARSQDVALTDVIFSPPGHSMRKSAWRSNVSGIVKAPEPLMWNIPKS